MSIANGKPDRLVRARELSERLAVCRKTLDGMLKRGGFPRPILIGSKAIAWFETEIDEWVASRTPLYDGWAARHHNQLSTPMNPIMGDRLIRLPEMKLRTSWSRSTIFKRVADGLMPSPVDVGGVTVAWRASDVDTWFASLMARAPRVRNIAKRREDPESGSAA